MPRASKARGLWLVSFALPACIAPHGVHAGSTETTPQSAHAAESTAARSAASPAPSSPFRALGETCGPASQPKLDFSRVRTAGRVDRSDPGALRFAWSGTEMSVHFSGTELQIELEDSGRNWFGVTLDGAAVPGKLSAYSGRHCYALAAPLAPGEHRLTLTRLTEAMLGESALVGANAGSSGRILAPDAPATRRVEVIGDSITAAYGVEGADRNCHFSSETENYALSYAALLGRRFRAEVSAVAWSGKGVFSNRGSTTDTVPMPVLWERTLPLREDSHWDFSAWAPDAVVIDLGTNDFAQENPDTAPFADAYRALLFRVRAVYPNAALFCALSPLLSDEWPPGKHARTSARAGIQAAVDAAKGRGDARVFYVEHRLATDREGWGCDWHPSRAVHARMADELAGPLAKNLGW